MMSGNQRAPALLSQAPATIGSPGRAAWAPTLCSSHICGAEQPPCHQQQPPSDVIISRGLECVGVFVPYNYPLDGHPRFADEETEAGGQIQSLHFLSLTLPDRCLLFGCYLFFPLQFSRRMGQKKQRLAKAEQPHSPSDTAQAPCPKEPCLGPPTTLGPYRSIYFSSPKGHLTRLGLEFFDQPAVPLARAFLGQVM